MDVFHNDILESTIIFVFFRQNFFVLSYKLRMLPYKDLKML